MKRRALLVASLALVSCAVGPDGTFGSGHVVARADRRPWTPQAEPETKPPAATPTVESPPAKPPVEVPVATAEHPFDDRLPAPEKATAHPHVAWPFHVEHSFVHLRVSPERHEIAGFETISVEDRADGLTELTLDAVDLQIGGVKPADPTDSRAPTDIPDVNFSYDGRTLRIPLNEPRRIGRIRWFAVEYSCRPTRGLYFNDGDAPQVYTQGEAEDSRHWFPCHDEPDDRTTYVVWIQAPDGWKVVSNGAERSPNMFWLDVPHVAYLTSFVAGDLRTVEQMGVVPLQFVVERGDEPHAAFDFRKTDAILRFYGDFTGLPYPYPNYKQTCVRNFMFGGMENIGATTLTDRTIHPPEWEPAHSSTGLIAHEAAHQWFGDWITCADWSHCWLNEGFATYFDALFTEHDEGRDAFLWTLRGLRHDALATMDRERRAVVSDKYVQPMDLFNGHAYAGGAVRLHMLRHLLGDDAFREAIRHYVKTCGLKCVTTDDFEKAVEESTGQDLKWFFDQWFRKPGYPKLKVRCRWDEAKSAVVVTVEQTQKADGGTPDAYRVPLDLRFHEAVIDGERVVSTVRLDVTKRLETFEVPLSLGRWEQIRVAVDPDTALLAPIDVGDPIVSVVRSRLVDDANPSVRADAAESLRTIARDEKRPADVRKDARDALLRGWSYEKSDPVRAFVLGQIGSLGGDDAADVLIGAMTGAADLRVRLAAADALHGFAGNAKAIEALTKLLDDPNDLLRASAVAGLAKLKASGAFDALVAAVGRPGFHSVVRAAALRAFADLGDERAFATLVRFAAPGDDDARGAAIESLGRMGRSRPEYHDAVLPYLDDPERHVRHSAADALAKIADPETIPTLVAHFQSETWPACREALRGAVKACRGAAVEENKLMSVESVRGAKLRERHAALRDEAAAVEKSLATLAGDAKTAAETKLASLKSQTSQLERDLAEIGVPVKPPPKKP